MVDHLGLQLALRARLLTLEVCTTGLIDLSSTATGYARPNGSFLSDRFAVGMEVTPSGFVAETTGVITALTALTMDIAGGREVEAEAPVRSISVGLPTVRAWENLTTEPVAGQPYIEDEYTPATRSLLGMPYDGGTTEDTGIYTVRWYTPANTGLGGIVSPASAMVDLFKPGTTVTASNGDQLRVRGDFGPVRGPIRQDGPSWSVITVTIPWRVYASN